jgi:hypothetical protein
MVSESARTASTVILISAGIVAASVVLATPPLRRLALVGMRLWLGSSLPVYLLTQIGHSWAEAGERRRYVIP